MTSKQLHIDRAAAGAGPDWALKADAAIRLWCRLKRGGTFAAWQLVQWANAKFPELEQANPKAWGARVQAAAKAGLIEHAGYGISPGRHGSICNLWVRA